MKSTLNNACISALLGGVPFGGTVNATGTASTPPGQIRNNPARVNTATPSPSMRAGASTSAAVSTSGDINNATAGNNDASVNTQTSANTGTSSGRMSHKAQANADAAELETTRQLNQQGVTTTGSAGATVH